MLDGPYQRTLQEVNTQVAEQCNSALELVCSQMAYMSQATFMQYARYFLFRYNRRKVADLKPRM